MSDVTILGMDEILKKLKVLPERVQKNVLSGAVRAGAKPIIDEAKRNVPTAYGSIKDSIGVKKASKPRVLKKTLLIYKISPMKKTISKRFKLKDGTKWSIKGEIDPWYAHFLEYGTYAKLDHPRKGKISRKRKKRRDAFVAAGAGIPAYAFMRKAYEAKGRESIDATRGYMAKRIDKEIAKL